MNTASMICRVIPSWTRRAAPAAMLGALLLGAAGCGTIGDSMTTRDVMTMKTDLSNFIAQQDAQNKKMDFSLNKIDDSLKGNNDIARQALDEVAKRQHEQMQEMEKLRGELQALRISLGKGGDTSMSGASTWTGTGTAANGAAAENPGMPGGTNSGATAAAPDTAAGQRLAAGLNAFTIGNYDEAGREFEAALGMNPNADQSTELEYWLGEIQYNKQDYPKALSHYRKAIETNRSHEKAWASLEKWALIKVAQGQKDSGFEYLKYIVQVNPTYSNIAAVKAKIRELSGPAKGDEPFSLMPVAPGAPAGTPAPPAGQ